MKTDYFLVNRKLTKSDLWLSEDFTRGQAWVDLIGLTNYQDGFIRKRGNKVELKRGQCGWSQIKLSERWGWSRGKVKRFLNELEVEHQIVQVNSTICSIITICNYDLYQLNGTTDKTPNEAADDATDGQQTTQQTDTKNEGLEVKNAKKGKNAKKESKTFVPPTRDDLQTFCEKNNLKIDIDDFIEFYGSKGWMVGRTKMKNWELAARRAVKWESNQRRSGGGSRNGGKVPADNLSTQDYNEGVNDDGTF